MLNLPHDLQARFIMVIQGGCPFASAFSKLFKPGIKSLQQK